MRINWFKDENNLVYINGATQLAELERTLHFPGLEEAGRSATCSASISASVTASTAASLPARACPSAAP